MTFAARSPRVQGPTASGPASVYGSLGSFGAGSLTVTTPSATVTASGGSGSYTYAWAYLSGTNGTINSSTSATTTFTRIVPWPTLTTGVFRCTVTDSVSGMTATVDVTVDTEALNLN